MTRGRNRWLLTPDGWIMKWHGSWWRPTREHGWQPVGRHRVQ
jgi:hypothetical protein